MFGLGTQEMIIILVSGSSPRLVSRWGKVFEISKKGSQNRETIFRTSNKRRQVRVEKDSGQQISALVISIHQNSSQGFDESLTCPEERPIAVSSPAKQINPAFHALK